MLVGAGPRTIGEIVEDEVTSAPASVGRNAPPRAGLVLVSLILVAAVANLNLAVANVALPDIGRAFDSSQTTLNLIAVGYSLGLAASVLWLGALGDRYGRKLMLTLGVTLSVPACLMAAYAGTDEVLFAARLLGGLSAGMAYPTTLALITALWSGQPRTRSIALWSATGGAIASLGPLIAGALFEHFWWGSVFLVTLPLAAIALVMALVFVPAHVNEETEKVDNLGGILSVVLVGALILAINFAPVPDKGTLVLGLAAIALVTGIAFVIRQRRVANPLYDLHIAARPTFWVAACAGIIVFGSLMGAMFIGQQFLQNVLDYSTFHAGLAILPAALLMVVIAPRSARLVATKGARFTLLVGYAFCFLGFLTMLLLWTEGISYWKVGLGYALDRRRSGIRRHAGVALAHGVGARPAGRDGVGHRRPATRPRWSRDAVDLRRLAHRRLRVGGLDTDRRLPGRLADQRQHTVGTDEVVRERDQPRQQLSRADPERDHRRRQVLVHRRAGLGVHGRTRGGPARGCARVLHVPQA